MCYVRQLQITFTFCPTDCVFLLYILLCVPQMHLKQSTALKYQLRYLDTLIAYNFLVCGVMSFEVNPEHLVLYKPPKKTKPKCCYFHDFCERLFLCFTLQSSLIQEVVQVKQSVSGGQVLDETLKKIRHRS